MIRDLSEILAYETGAMEQLPLLEERNLAFCLGQSMCTSLYTDFFTENSKGCTDVDYLRDRSIEILARAKQESDSLGEFALGFTAALQFITNERYNTTEFANAFWTAVELQDYKLFRSLL